MGEHFEPSPDAAVILGVAEDGRIVFAGWATQACLGFGPGELVGLPFESLVAEPHRPQQAARHARIFSDPAGTTSSAPAELRCLRRDGSEFPAEAAESAVELDGARLAAVVLRDVSGHPDLVSRTRLSPRARAEKAEDETRKAGEREATLLRELHQTRRLESVGQLAGGIAHDFNNLLGIILNYATFVADTLPPESEARADLEHIRTAAERGAALTRQLLIFSRREVVAREPIDLNELVTGLEHLLRQALGKRVELETSLEEGLWPIEADRGQIEQVLVNLAVNGRDAMPQGGRLIIETANTVLSADVDGSHLAAGDYVLLTVSDTGMGMHEEVRQRAFEPFFTTKPKTEGTGLGLATVYGIVTDAGGRIALYSETRLGTSVRVQLPASVSAVPARPADAVRRAQPGRGETVLITENEDEVRRMVGRVLAEAGYVVLSASGGLHAQRAAASTPIDLLVTDVVMPGMVGTELVERMRANRPELRVLFMSGYSPRVLSESAFEPEAGSGFLEKPFSANDLLQKVRELLDAGTAARPC